MRNKTGQKVECLDLRRWSWCLENYAFAISDDWKTRSCSSGLGEHIERVECFTLQMFAIVRGLQRFVIKDEAPLVGKSTKATVFC